jgi:HK97 family phage major capsid protein
VTNELAAAIVREATAATRGERRTASTSSYAEFRSATQSGRPNLGYVERGHELTWWKYMTSPLNLLSGGTDEPAWSPSRFLFEPAEQRVLSRATNAGGGFIVPSDFGAQITSARRARNVIGDAARQIETDHGRVLPLPSASAHGTAAWTAENAAVTASDDTFAQVSLGAFKGTTKTIVSEELLNDALEDFDAYLADELGQRLALLEEAAFAQGDGAGKPLGIVTSGNGVATVTAATGSATGFKLADVAAAWAAVPDGYKPNASWVMSPSAFASLANLTDSGGGLVLPTLHSENPTLYTRPVLVSSGLPATAASARSVVVETSRRATPSGAYAALASIASRSSTPTRARWVIASSPALTGAFSWPTRFGSSSIRQRERAVPLSFRTAPASGRRWGEPSSPARLAETAPGFASGSDSRAGVRGAFRGALHVCTDQRLHRAGISDRPARRRRRERRARLPRPFRAPSPDARA